MTTKNNLSAEEMKRLQILQLSAVPKKQENSSEKNLGEKKSGENGIDKASLDTVFADLAKNFPENKKPFRDMQWKNAEKKGGKEGEAEKMALLGGWMGEELSDKKTGFFRDKPHLAPQNASPVPHPLLEKLGKLPASEKREVEESIAENGENGYDDPNEILQRDEKIKKMVMDEARKRMVAQREQVLAQKQQEEEGAESLIDPLEKAKKGGVIAVWATVAGIAGLGFFA